MKLSIASGLFSPLSGQPVSPDAHAGLDAHGGPDALTAPSTVLTRLMHLIGITGRSNRACRMQIVETLPLGNRRQVTLVVCNGRHYLVGCGPDAVTAIAAVSGDFDPEQTCR